MSGPVMRTTFIVLGALSVLAVLAPSFAEESYSPELQAKLAELRERGAPLSLAEAAPKAPPADQNAATLYTPLFQANFDPDKPEYPQGTDKGLNRLESRARTPSDLTSGDWATAEALRPVLATAEAQQALRVLREASRRPQCVFPVRWQDGIYAVFPHLPEFRRGTRLCAAQAMLDARAGDMSGALDWLGVCYRMADQAAQDPTLVAQLTGYSMLAMTNRAARAILCAADPTPDDAQMLLDHIDRLQVAPHLERALLGEQAMGLDCFRMIVDGKTNLAEIAELSGSDISPPNTPKLPAGPMKPYWELEALNYLKCMATVIERNKQPYRMTAALPDCDRMLRGETANLLSRTLVPVAYKFSRLRDRAVADLELLRTGLALRLIRSATGSYPASLDALGPTRVRDIFTGRDFIYRREGNGFRLYSVGINLRDDGRVGHELHPAGVAGSGTDDILWECAR